MIELQADAPNLDYDGIVEFLGEPESLANSLMDDIDPEVILSYQKRKHRLHIARIVSVVALIAVLSTSFLYSIHSIHLKSSVQIVRSDSPIYYNIQDD